MPRDQAAPLAGDEPPSADFAARLRGFGRHAVARVGYLRPPGWLRDPRYQDLLGNPTAVAGVLFP